MKRELGMAVSGEAEVRAAVHRAWTEALPGAELDETLTWQEAGVDSLKSLQLLLVIETALGRPISFDLFTRETRIRDLISILSGQGATSREDLRRAWLVPGMFGDDPGLAELRARLRDEVAFETLQLPDLASPMSVTGDLDATAAILADQVLDRSDGGPIVLAGYSFGAHAAVATALALQARGAAVDLLCLFDPLPGPLDAPPAVPKSWSRLGNAGSALSAVSTVLVRRLVSLGFIGAARRLALLSVSLPDFDGAQKRRREVIGRLREKAVGGWRPQPFHGRTLLFASDDFERTGDPRPYLDLLPGVTIMHVGGDHLHLFEGEALRTIVETLRANLAGPPAQDLSIASSASRSGL